MIKYKVSVYSNFKYRNAKHFITSPGKFLDYGKYACVKDLTNIMSSIHIYVPKTNSC